MFESVGRGSIASIFFASSILALSLSGTASAGLITSQTFDTDPVLSDTKAPGTWYTDRFAPAGFTSQSFLGDNRLAHTISAADAQPVANNFRNTQGRKFDVTGATSISIDFYIDSAFDGASGRIGGLWGTGVAADGVTITSYPIIEFFDNQFQVYDSIDGDADGAGFREAGLQEGFAFDEFVNLAILLDTTDDEFLFFVNGELLHKEEAGGTQSIDNVILQNINTSAGVNRTLFFDNLQASVPAPAALPLFAAGLGLMGLFARRRKAMIAAA